MSIVSYNGVVLPYAMTTQFKQDPVYDELSQTDWCLTKYDITVECLINTNYLSLLISDFNPATVMSPADIMQVIRARLLKPRKQLSFTFNGVELIPKVQEGNTGTCDAKNGPQPMGCDLKQLTNTTYLMIYHVVAHYWESTLISSVHPEGSAGQFKKNPKGNNVIYNRWEESVEMDNCMYTKKTRHGRYVIRSDNTGGVTVDDIRPSFANLGLEKGFVRESSQYKVSPDGLALEYTIVDKEVYRYPPPPAYEAKGDYFEETTRYGAYRVAVASIELRGPKYVDQAELVRTAFMMCSAKLRLNGIREATSIPKVTTTTIPFVPLHTGGGFLNIGAEALFNLAQARLNTVTTVGPVRRFRMIDWWTVRADMFDNKVQVRVHAVMRPTVAPGMEKNVFDGTGFGFDPSAIAAVPYDGGRTNGPQPAYASRGTAGIVLQAAAYWDPSLANVAMDGVGVQLQRGAQVGTAGKNLELL